MRPDIECRYLTQWWKRPDLTLIGDRTVRGVVARFGKRSTPASGFVEVIDPSFFRKGLSTHGMHGATSRFNSNDMALLGSSISETLRFSQDEQHGHGLLFEVDVPQAFPLFTEYVKRRDVADIALGWQVYEDRWEHTEGYPVRHLVSGRLLSVDPMMSANRDPVECNAALRSLAAKFDELIEKVVVLGERNELWRLWGTDHAPKPKIVIPERDPILLGRNGRAAHIEVMAPAGEVPGIMDAYVVKASPADLAIVKGRQDD